VLTTTAHSYAACAQRNWQLLSIFQGRNGRWEAHPRQPSHSTLVDGGRDTGIALPFGMVALSIGSSPAAQAFCAELQLKRRGWFGTSRMAGPDGHVLIYRGTPPEKDLEVVPGIRLLGAGSILPLPPTRGFEWLAPGPIWTRDTVTEPMVFIEDGQRYPRGEATVESAIAPVPDVLLAALKKAA
jgi:hypothetical protein